MDLPLSMIRGEDGIVRDVNGRPVIVIFDSKHTHSAPDKPVVDADGLGGMHDGPQPLEFINLSGATKEDTQARTLIRTHVMEDYKRRKKIQKSRPCQAYKAQLFKNTTPLSSHGVGYHPSGTPFPYSQPSGSLDPFASYPVQMLPYMYKFIHHYITVIVPAITEPGWKDTFPLAMQDAALFHAILLRSALHANSATGTFKPSELVLHKIKTIQLVNEKLQNPSERLSDSMIMTVAFLAIIECTSADYTAWDLHMNGLSLIIEMRGGMTTLDKWLQLMVYRFDFLGCLATNSRPHFPLPADLINRHPATEPGTLGPYDGFKVITSSFSLDSEIITILNDLQGLLAVKGAEINSCNSPEDVTYITVSLRHRLLLCSPVEPLVTQSNSLSEACRLGLLLYLKTAIACPISYENLLDKLRTCLTSVKMNTDMRPAIAEMVLWLMFLGGTAVPNGPNRAWFVAQLCNTATTLHIHSWDRAKLVLMKFLLIDKMHERLFLDLWQEVLILKSLTRGG